MTMLVVFPVEAIKYVGDVFASVTITLFADTYSLVIWENTDRKDELVVMNVNLFTRIVWLSSSEDGKVNAAIEEFVTPGQITASKGVNPA